MFAMRLFRKERELTYHYLFVSMPLSFEDDTNNDDEGMIGKILKIVRAVNKENQTGIQENRDKIDGIQGKLT